MVQINQVLKNGFQTQFPGTTVNTAAAGTEKGIQALQSGTADVAAISRPLTSQEQSQGLAAVPVTKYRSPEKGYGNQEALAFPGTASHNSWNH
jgi:phosphate transport system substrate-binding protein